ncbi:uncharacterized protein PV07_12562 [Cladophialophora immunda]|uniref:Asl1-like glycosyl hydrolase catalytic domain-containing protein n=1 Tax=Cladophialophora immunda TaxID=569365 RepID=A0A0D2CEU1_9EURO|nr:uncharacterized protein PV07_12562 [Cladophialophora immunda]KIW22044.1 hypothetical protein PV07_12562 [Cladophialophora immunda]
MAFGPPPPLEVTSGVSLGLSTSVASVTASMTASMTSNSVESNTASSSSGGLSAEGKKGLAYNDASLTDAFDGRGMTWAYNWAASPGGQLVAGVEFVPMLWGLVRLDTWSSSVNSAIASGAKHALGFNEPDDTNQANLTAAMAASYHIQYMNPLAGQVSIGSPAVTNGDGLDPPQGVHWLQAFFTACAGKCEVDFVAFHWYGSVSDIAGFQQHVEDVTLAAAAANVTKLWLTEFGANGTDADVASFLTQAVNFLDSTTQVERYAYFMCSDGILVNGGTISSPIGEAYVG